MDGKLQEKQPRHLLLYVTSVNLVHNAPPRYSE
jgi:hypothetical protein